MLIRGRFLWAAGLMAIGAALAAPWAWADDAPFKAGDHVVTTQQAPVKATEGTLATLEGGVELTVADVKQGWVGVTGERNGQKIAGWVRPKYLAPAEPAEPAESAQAFKRGYAAHLAGDLERAAADYTEAIRLNPKSVRAYNNRAVVYQSQGDLERAIADFSAAIRLDPTSSRAYQSRAAAYETQGDLAKADADLAEARRVYRPKYDTIAHKAVRIELEVKGKDFAPNYELLDSIIDEAKAKVTRKSAYVREDVIDILKIIDRILYQHRFLGRDDIILCDALMPRRASPKLLEGADARKFRFRPRMGETIHFTNCLTNTLIYAAIGEALGLPIGGVAVPEHVFARWTFPDMRHINWETTNGSLISDADYAATRNIATDAVRSRAFLHTLSEDELLAGVLSNLGAVWHGQWPGLENEYREASPRVRNAKAIIDLNKAIDMSPRFSQAYSNRGMSYYVMGEPEKALNDFGQALALNPRGADAYYGRGAVWLQRGDTQRAIDDFNKSLALNPQRADAYRQRGIAWVMRGDLQKAMDDCNQAIALCPALTDAYVNRAMVWATNRQFEKAMEDLNKALTLDPRNADIYRLRANVWQSLNQPDKARADLERAESLGRPQ
jgi:tetratricopeptide (TPR) repeat protein